MRCGRDCRNVLKKWTGYARRAVPNRTDVETIEGYSTNMIRHNTILFPDQFRQDRLVKSVFAEAEKREGRGDGKYRLERLQIDDSNVLDNTYPLDTFLLEDDNGNKKFQEIDATMEAAIELLFILQERARVHGLPRWSKLHKDCLPSVWQDHLVGDKGVAKRKAMQESDPDGFGGCSKCKWPEEISADDEPSVAEQSGRSKRRRQTSEESVSQPTSTSLRGDSYPASFSKTLAISGRTLLPQYPDFSDDATDDANDAGFRDTNAAPAADNQGANATYPDPEGSNVAAQSPESTSDILDNDLEAALLPANDTQATQSSSDPEAIAEQDPASDQAFLNVLDPRLFPE